MLRTIMTVCRKQVKTPVGTSGSPPSNLMWGNTLPMPIPPAAVSLSVLHYTICLEMWLLQQLDDTMLAVKSWTRRTTPSRRPVIAKPQKLKSPPKQFWMLTLVETDIRYQQLEPITGLSAG